MDKGFLVVKAACRSKRLFFAAREWRPFRPR